MASITVNDVSVSFPIYSSGSRSLKNAVIAASTGGRIGQDERHVVVQALENVSLEIGHGDRVALIGHNGAGKTTLLRVLAGIFEPIAGDIVVEGRVTPLFDIHLGIDPESTGYENMILRGLYLGLSRAEVLAKMDSVAEFTELGEFLKFPVRTYSAGMQTRLAFAMTTSIEPDVLLLDEGIGAGDAAFVEKAAKRLDSFIERAGVLVLASHAPNLVRRLCNKAVVMEHGRVVWTGDVEGGLRIGAGPA
jgi:ABC-2 type transport system ATP-binding protein/lipopolysaccharide transport system ATP-binding protein